MALQQLYISTSGPQWYSSTGWTTNGSANISTDSTPEHCSWFGITCCGSDGTAQTPDGELMCSANNSVVYVVSAEQTSSGRLLHAPQPGAT